MIKPNITLRIILDILIAISVIQGWWFVALVLGCVGMWIYAYFIELVVAGIAYDALFGMVPGMGFVGYIGTCVSIIMYTILVTFATRMRRS